MKERKMFTGKDDYVDKNYRYLLTIEFKRVGFNV